MTPIGQKNWHLLNHCSTGVLFPAIKNIAQKYHDEFYCYEDYEPIGINDRALPHGGVFDTNNNWRGVALLTPPWEGGRYPVLLNPGTQSEQRYPY